MKPGSLVICIDDTNWCNKAFVSFDKLPVQGKVYEVRQIFDNIETPESPEMGVALCEIQGTFGIFQRYDGVWVYLERHFRIERFQELLPPIEISLKDLLTELVTP